MTFDFASLMDLWTGPLPASRQDATAAFRARYTDPVLVNGNPIHAEDLVDRARNMQAAIADIQREILDICDAGDKVAVAFRLTGRQIGDYPTSAGVIAPTGRVISLRIVDILTLTGGRISEITMIADELAAFTAVQAVAVVTR